MSTITLLSSIMASSTSAWRGTMSLSPAEKQPEKLLELYEFEGCPYCRLVRETLCALDIDAMIYPSPKGGERFRPTAIEKSGQSQFPLLIDPNTGDTLLESADIIDHLFDNYAANTDRTAARGLRRAAQLLGSNLSTAVRGGRGLQVRPSNPPEQPLELYSFESSPFSRPVREVLCELEIPYRLRNCAKSRWEEMGPPEVRSRFFPDAPITGPGRIRLRELTGRSQVPYLVDANHDVAMFESQDIIRYLESTYGVAYPPA